MNQKETEALIFGLHDIQELAKDYRVSNKINHLRKTLGLSEVTMKF